MPSQTSIGVCFDDLHWLRDCGGAASGLAAASNQEGFAN
jgi:hypothetical protein